MSSRFEDSNVRLEPDIIARDKAVARLGFSPGSVITVARPLVTAILPSEKQKRCDYCHRIPDHDTSLFKCTGCASHWYCDAQCQSLSWKAHHRRICKSYPLYIASPAHGLLPPQERMDALLLAQLAAETSSADPAPDESSPFSIFMSLMPSKSPPSHLPHMPVHANGTITRNHLLEFYSRFGNNNFIMHSHLISFGHGIYPLASRLFNHSCVPNAAIRYSIMQGRPPLMEVVALRRISVGEEICIPYVDPALPLEDRERALGNIYGFSCSCALCHFQRGISASSSDGAISAQVRRHLLDFTGCSPDSPPLRHDTLQNFSDIPASLRSLFHPSVLPDLAESFSAKSHSASLDAALVDGLTLLALYHLIYPPNYPQTGMHALEAAKTTWNAMLSSEAREGSYDRKLLDSAKWYLEVARHILGILGKEGDADGPLTEVEMLSGLISEELAKA
ncbi:hypothetical protein BC834DRAFT_922711 [Gloeopeniophorella convolvens]|nr:hypothetical protein BC834DRAFT_922711 [Gloeopeniophorella convolvens]